MIYRKRTQKDVTDSKIIEIWNECLGEAKTALSEILRKLHTRTLYGQFSFASWKMFLQRN